MREISYIEAIREALREEMLRDSAVILLGEDIGFYGGVFGQTRGLLDEFGSDRVMDTPISENGFVGAAIGASIAGMRPVVEIMYNDFLMMALDQIINHAAKFHFISGGQAKVPIVIRTQQSIGHGNSSQHSQCLESLVCNIPGLKVVMPSTPYDVKGLLKSSIRDNNCVIFIETRLLYKKRGDVPEEDYTIPIGLADIKRKGNDITIVAVGRMVDAALQAAEELSKKGIDAEVIDPRTLVPLDKKTIVASVKKTGRIVICHEACKSYGIGAEISATISEEIFEYLKSPIKRVAALDTPIPYNKKLEDHVLPNVSKIIDNVIEITDGR